MKLKSKKPPLYLLSGVTVIGLMVMAGSSATAAETASQAPADSSRSSEISPSADAATEPVLQSGRVVHVDPRTGLKTLPSQAQRAAGQAHLGSIINRSSAGLIETASPSSGVMVNLLGRFRHATLLNVNQNGDVTSECSASAPAEPTADAEEAHRD